MDLPAAWTERQGEDDGDTEDEEHTTDTVAVLCAVLILGVQGGLTDQHNSNRNRAEHHGLATSNPVGQEQNEDQVGDGANTVVDANNKDVPATRDTKRVVHDSLVVVDDVDVGHLSEDLDKSTMPRITQTAWSAF